MQALFFILRRLKYPEHTIEDILESFNKLFNTAPGEFYNLFNFTAKVGQLEAPFINLVRLLKPVRSTVRMVIDSLIDGLLAEGDGIFREAKEDRPCYEDNEEHDGCDYDLAQAANSRH